MRLAHVLGTQTVVCGPLATKAPLATAPGVVTRLTLGTLSTETTAGRGRVGTRHGTNSGERIDSLLL